VVPAPPSGGPTPYAAAPGGGASPSVTELRELARGIYTPLLTERGPVAALQSTARRSAVPVTLDVADVERTDP